MAQLLPALVEEFEVTVAAHGDGPLRDAALAAGARWIELRHMRRSIGARDVLGLVEIVRLIRRERPTIVHAHSSKAGLLARLAAALCRTPAVVFTVHGWAFKAEPGYRSRLYLWADRLGARFTTMVICVSETERREGLAARTCRPDRTIVIRNGVELERPRADPRAATPPLLVSVGRLKAPKDFETLLEAVARLDAVPSETVIVGDGPDRALLEATATRLGVVDRVRFAGTRDDVHAILASASCFVLSSTSEGLPVSILEAMAAGLPVVASRVGGVPELVDDGVSGMLVPPRDPKALADALRRLLADAQLRARLGAAARARVEAGFGLDRFRREHVELYRSLTPGRNG